MKTSLTIIAYVSTLLIPIYFGLLNSRENLWVQTSVLRHFIVQPPAGFWLVIFFAVVAATSHIWLNNLPTPLKIVQSLEKEFSRQLGGKDAQIRFLQGQIESLQKVEEPSPLSPRIGSKDSGRRLSICLGIEGNR